MTVIGSTPEEGPKRRSHDASAKHGQVAYDTPAGTAALDALVKIYADLVDDAERVRIATENRIRSLQQVKGMTGTPEEKRLMGMVELLRKVERAAVRDLERSVAAHPLGGWAQSQIGVGLKTMGRLMGSIGRPGFRFHAETGELTPRTVSQLWAYCGLDVRDGKAPRHRAGVQSNWNTKARTSLYLMAEACMKNRRSPFRATYEMGRAKYNGDTPPWLSDKRAMRLVMKELCKSMWRFDRGQAADDAQRTTAPVDSFEGVIAPSTPINPTSPQRDVVELDRGLQPPDTHATRAPV